MTSTQVRQYPQEVEGAEAAPGQITLQKVVLRHVVRPAYIGLLPEHPSWPQEMLIGSLLDSTLRILQPITVKLTSDGNQIVAHAVDLDEFGYGETALEAINDLQHTVAELFSELEKSQDRLGSDLQRVWQILSSRVKRTT